MTPGDLGGKIRGQIWNQRVLISRYRNYQKKIVTLKGIRINQRIARVVGADPRSGHNSFPNLALSNNYLTDSESVMIVNGSSTKSISQ